MLIDNKTGKKVDNAIKKVENLSSVKNFDGSITETYNVDVEIPVSKSDQGDIHINDTTGGSQTAASCQTTLNITYFMNGAGDQIKITNIKGGWTPQSSLLVISKREAAVTDGRGPFIEKTLRQYPTTNSFNYDTGWGYCAYVGGSQYTGARGYTQATLSISGMGGTYSLFCPVAINA